eukprot:gene12810-14123_t
MDIQSSSTETSVLYPVFKEDESLDKPMNAGTLCAGKNNFVQVYGCQFKGPNRRLPLVSSSWCELSDGISRRDDMNKLRCTNSGDTRSDPNHAFLDNSRPVEDLEATTTENRVFCNGESLKDSKTTSRKGLTCLQVVNGSRETDVVIENGEYEPANCQCNNRTSSSSPPHCDALHRDWFKSRERCQNGCSKDDKKMLDSCKCTARQEVALIASGSTRNYMKTFSSDSSASNNATEERRNDSTTSNNTTEERRNDSRNDVTTVDVNTFDIVAEKQVDGCGGEEEATDNCGCCCKWINCNERLKTAVELKTHVKDTHVKTMAASDLFFCFWQGCKVYNKPSSSYNWLVKHVNTHVGIRPFQCIIEPCDQSFASQAALSRHVQSHFNERSKYYKKAKGAALTEYTCNGSNGSSRRTGGRNRSLLHDEADICGGESSMRRDVLSQKFKMPMKRRRTVTRKKDEDGFDRRAMAYIKNKLLLIESKATCSKPVAYGVHNMTNGHCRQILGKRILESGDVEYLVPFVENSVRKRKTKWIAKHSFSSDNDIGRNDRADHMKDS